MWGHTWGAGAKPIPRTTPQRALSFRGEGSCQLLRHIRMGSHKVLRAYRTGERASSQGSCLPVCVKECPLGDPMSLRNFLFPPAWWRGLSACFQRQPLTVPSPNTQPQESPAPSFPCHGSLPTLCPPRMLPSLVTARSNSA